MSFSDVVGFLPGGNSVLALVVARALLLCTPAAVVVIVMFVVFVFMFVVTLFTLRARDIDLAHTEYNVYLGLCFDLSLLVLSDSTAYFVSSVDIIHF